MFSFLWLVEAKIEILKLGHRGREVCFLQKNMHKPNFALQCLFPSARGTLLRNNAAYKFLYNAGA